MLGLGFRVQGLGFRVSPGTRVHPDIAPVKQIEYGRYIELYRGNGKESGNYYIIIVSR